MLVKHSCFDVAVFFIQWCDESSQQNLQSQKFHKCKFRVFSVAYHPYIKFCYIMREPQWIYLGVRYIYATGIH